MPVSFIGSILPWPGDYPPRDWALCQGQRFLIHQYLTLYSLLGVKYGGDGKTTFCLPDLCRRFPVGAGQGLDTSDYQLGQSSGDPTVDPNSLPAHSHIVIHTPTASLCASRADGTTTTPSPTRVLAKGVTSNPAYTPYIYGNQPTDTTVGGGQVTGDITCQPVGSSQPLPPPPYLAMNYIICFSGWFPSRY